MISTLILFFIEIISFGLVFNYLTHYDEDYKKVSFSKSFYVVLFIELISSALLLHAFKNDLVLGTFVAMGLGVLLTSAMIDYLTTLIPDWLYYFSCLFFIGVVVISVLNQMSFPALLIAELVIFMVLQLLVFSRTFGFSDALAYSAFGILCFSLGLGWVPMMSSMVISYMVLIVVQLIKRNIGKNLRLKKPVAFIPYIYFSYMMVISMCLIKEI